MNVLILSINAAYSHSSLSAFILKSALRREGIRTSVLEAVINDPLRRIVTAAAARKPTHILLPSYIWNARKMEAFARDIRLLLPDTVLIAGGPQSYTFDAPEDFKGLFDIVVRGECEGEIGTLLKSRPGRPESPLLLSFEPPDFKNLPFPYTEEDLESLSNRIAYYESIRGCPYTCGYCISGSECTGRKSLSFKDPDDVFKDIDMFLAAPPKMVKFVDRTFNVRADHAHRIWTHLADLPADAPRLTFQFELHPGRITNEDIRILKEMPAGRVQLEIGVQSVTPEVLNESGRRGQDDWPGIKGILSELNGLDNIRTHLDQIVGLPLSDFKEAEHSMNQIMGTRPGYFQLGFLKIIPGTDFERKKKEYGFVHSAEPPYEVYKTKWMDETGIEDFKKAEWSVDALYNGGGFQRSLPYLTSRGSFLFFRGFYDRYVETLGESGQSPSKQWNSLALCILDMFRNSEDFDYIRDLVMLDWCDRSGSGLYPPGISPRDKKEMERKREAVWKILKKNDFEGLPRDFSMRLYNKSILYLPVTQKAAEIAGGKTVLFIPSGGLPGTGTKQTFVVG